MILSDIICEVIPLTIHLIKSYFEKVFFVLGNISITICSLSVVVITIKIMKKYSVRPTTHFLPKKPPFVQSPMTSCVSVLWGLRIYSTKTSTSLLRSKSYLKLHLVGTLLLCRHGNQFYRNTDIRTSLGITCLVVVEGFVYVDDSFLWKIRISDKRAKDGSTTEFSIKLVYENQETFFYFLL